ncbi:MAG: hypothetical protein ABMA26_25535 [Limisphaerales bacterium]
MKRATQTGLLLAVICCAALTAGADAVGDYKVILDRNPFALKPPLAPPPPQTNAPPETPTNYKLTGITALFKPRRAMFVNMAVPSKPDYISLSEGQRQGSLEILADGINVKAGTVRVKISGEERTMSFDKDGLKSAGAPAMTASGAPPFNQLNPVPATPGGSIAPPQNFQGGYQGGPGTFNRGAAPAMQAAPVAVQGSFGVGVPSTARQVRIPIGDAAPVQSSPPPAPVVDRAEQVLRMEINRKLTEVQVQRGELPPLPTTELSPPSPQLPPLPGPR